MSAVLRLAAALVGIADAEDATQEAILRAWQAWPTLRNRDAVRIWLLRIAANVCHNWQRGRFGTRLHMDRPIGSTIGIAEPQAREADDPGSNAHAATLDLLAAVASLEENLRVAVALRYFGGFDATEIGEILDVPPSTIRSRLGRALALMRSTLSIEDQTSRI